jgi:hypothetical protein
MIEAEIARLEANVPSVTGAMLRDLEDRLDAAGLPRAVEEGLGDRILRLRGRLQQSTSTPYRPTPSARPTMPMLPTDDDEDDLDLAAVFAKKFGCANPTLAVAAARGQVMPERRVDHHRPQQQEHVATDSDFAIAVAVARAGGCQNPEAAVSALLTGRR